MKIDWSQNGSHIKNFVDTYHDMNEEQLVGSLIISIQSIDISRPEEVQWGLPEKWRENQKKLHDTVNLYIGKIKEELCSRWNEGASAIRALDSEKEFQAWLTLFADQIRRIIKDQNIEPFSKLAEDVVPGLTVLILVIRTLGKLTVASMEQLCGHAEAIPNR